MIPHWTERKREIYQCWQIQESNLHATRTLTISSQAMMLAATAVVFNLAYESYSDVRGLGACLASAGTCPTQLFTYLMSVSLIFIFSGLSLYALWELHNIILHREKLITMFQNLLVREEGGRLEKELEQLEINGLTPLFSALKIVGTKTLTLVPPCSHILANQAAWEYFRNRYESKDPEWDFRTGELRGLFKNIIIVFYGFWLVSILVGFILAAIVFGSIPDSIQLDT